MKGRIFRERYKINEPGTISHITQRAPGREVLFLEKADYLYMLHLVKETVVKFSLELFAFVFLPNHIHLLLRQSQKNLSSAMKNLFERYADFFNTKYKRKGHVFCGRFRQSVCLDENYFFTIILYIHLNPVRAGLVTDPLDYQWSSCRPYVTPIARESFLNYQYVLNMLNPNIDKAREIYRGILKEAIAIKSGDVLEDPKAMDSFRIGLNKIICGIFGDQIKNLSIFNIDLDEKIGELKRKQHLKSPQEIEARRYLIQQLKSRGYSPAEIAEKLGISKRSVFRYGA